MFGVRSDAVWVSFLLLNVLVVIGLRSTVGHDPTPLRSAQSQIQKLKDLLKQTELREALLSSQIEDDRAFIAPLLPAAQKRFRKGDREDYQLRSLASVITSSGREIRIERASSLLKRAKAAFHSGRLEEASKLLSQILQQYPSSVHSLEAHYLLSESMFRLGQTEAALAVSESMIRFFPTSELTGFALLQVGQALESRERPEDAVEVYNAVLNHFDQQELQRIAVLRKRALE